MADLPPLLPMADAAPDADTLPAPLGGTRAEAIRRLQIGFAGLAAILMMIGLANIVMDRAKQTEATTVPEAAAPVASAPAEPGSDPLADAGVVPDVPAQQTGERAPGNGSSIP